MNLLAAIIIYWNTRKLGEIVMDLVNKGEAPPSELLAHVSPLGWEHIIGRVYDRCRPGSPAS